MLKTERHGCYVGTDEPVTGGIFYAETYRRPAGGPGAPASRAGLARHVGRRQARARPRPANLGRLAAASAPRCGSKRAATACWCAWRIPQTSIRVLYPDGRPFGAKGSIDAAPPYSIVPPRVTHDPNILDRYIKDGNVVDPDDDLLRYIGSYLADVEGQGDVASVWIEPLVTDPASATGAVARHGRQLHRRRPDLRRLAGQGPVRELHERAVSKDPGLWRSQAGAGAVGGRASRCRLGREPRQGAGRHVPGGAGRARRAVPTVRRSSAGPRSTRTPSSAWSSASRSDVDVLSTGVDVYDSIGETKKADELVQRIRKLDPDNEIVLTRALSREDYDDGAGRAETHRQAAARAQGHRRAHLRRDGPRRQRQGDLEEARRSHQAEAARAAARGSTWPTPSTPPASTRRCRRRWSTPWSAARTPHR